MALFNPTFVFGVLVLLYLSSFVLFAIIRIVTGLSIQRIGYFSLRRLAYVPRDGFKIEIRGLGLNIHRPTFSQPTWLSIVVSELVVTVDVGELEGVHSSDEKSRISPSTNGDDHRAQTTGSDHGKDKNNNHLRSRQSTSKLQSHRPPRNKATNGGAKDRSKTWVQLLKMKERIKRLHRNLGWLRLVDVVATNSAVNVVGVGNIQFGSFAMAVDTRLKMVDRGRFLFQGRQDTAHPETSQAEWVITLRSVLFTPKGRDSMEIMDNATLNIHGFLHEALDGLLDSAIALKLGRVHLPCDDLLYCADLYRDLKKSLVPAEPSPAPDAESRGPMSPILEDDPFIDTQSASDNASDNTSDDADEKDLVKTVADSKEFVSSILRGIKEVQFAISYLGIAKNVPTVKAAGAPVLLMNASMKEIGIDLHRLDHKSPAHRMYFSPKDIAHEALAAALSISISVDDGHGQPQRIMYIPMITTTVKTTLPAKSVEIKKDITAEERNANILFANSVVTSPSVDLAPRHLPLLLAMLNRPKKPRSPAVEPKHGHYLLLSRLLPKANIKISMHEPVIRIALPPVSPTADPDDFDLIISSISSISLDIESFHSTIEKLHYSLASTMRLTSHHLFYQTSRGDCFDLLMTESFDLKTQLSASPDVNVVVTGNLQTFSVKLVRPEIIDGLRHIVLQLRPDVVPDKKRVSLTEPKHKANFLCSLPSWLLHVHMQSSDFDMEVAGIDKRVSGESRGVAVQLESWSLEYRAQRLDSLKSKRARRRTVSRSVLLPDAELLASLPSTPQKKHHHNGDGRRIAMHGRGFEAFIVESMEKWEMDPFVNIPRFEVAFTTLSDSQGPMLHLHSHIRTLHANYSLQRHYSVGVAVMVLKQTLAHPSLEVATKQQGVAEPAKPTGTIGPSLQVPTSPTTPEPQDPFSGGPPAQLVAVDIKIGLVQIKAELPSDPPIMLSVHNLEAGRHRWSSPFVSWKLIRFQAEAPRMPKVWARVLSIKNGRLTCKETQKKLPTGAYKTERAFDVATEVIRFAVPHELIMYKIVDNIANTVKSVQQLHHRFKTGTDEYILGKGAEGPKEVPQIAIRCRTFAVELEDGGFEWKLGMIYRAGRVEQMQRLAREEAFRVKVKKLQQDDDQRRVSSKFRARSAAPPRGRHASGNSETRSQSADRNHNHNARPSVGRTPRYDPEGSSLGMTGSAHVTIGEARQKLNLHNSRSWKQRIDRAYLMAKNGMRDIRSMFWGIHTPEDDANEHEHILGVPNRPALMAAIIDDLHVIIDRPSFPMAALPDFLYNVGKGIPRDMLYSLLVPMNIQIRMGEAKVTLRDYPLPLLHVPGLAPSQGFKQHALVLSSDFVIAEEFQGPESMRHIKVDILPPKSTEPGASKEGNFAIDVMRTTSQVKTYSDMNIDINTSLPTKITWGPSYQPAIQDMMMIFESFTKPQLDPSESVGFWDKIRLSFHSRMRIAWKADGNVHFALKGTRDPYQVTGNGAGFLMCWRNDVRCNIHVDDDPKKLMTVDSGEYVLAVPDYSHHAREVNRQSTDSDSVSSEDTLRSGAAFKKVVMKLSGRVQWLAGLVFERPIVDGKRSFDFDPHYSIFLKAPQYAKPQADGLPYDAFRGFRSQHIHMSLAVRAPVDRDWTVSNTEPSRSYNTVHLSPRFFTHFFAWWSLFSGPMSLPIRQGKLWPGCEKSSKKFGRHLATIKYNLFLAPLFLSHMYKHKDPEDHDINAFSATGIKVRFDSFMLDLHQRREEFNTRDKGRKTQSRTSGIKIHACQLDLASADIRAVSASIRGISPETVRTAGPHFIHQHQEEETADISRFTIPDDDFSWIDMDDFVELDWIIPTQPNPDTKILPLAFAPRVTYFRQTDIGGVISGDPDRTSPFGHESTNLCIMALDDPRSVQMHLISSRLEQLEEQIEAHVRDISETAQLMNGENNAVIAGEIETLSRQANVLQEKKLFLETFMTQLAEDAAAAAAATAGRARKPTVGSRKTQNVNAAADDQHAALDGEEEGGEFASEFTNRFTVHNMKLKWNNMLRNIILRYIHQVSQRRGFVYYLSRPAVKFILDIVEEQVKLKAAAASPATGDSASIATASGASGTVPTPDPSAAPGRPDPTSSKDIEDRIRKILQDGRKFVTDDGEGGEGGGKKEGTVYSTPMEDLAGGIAAEFTPQNNYHVRLIAPQIQLQSDKNKKHVVLVTAKGMDLKVVEVMDKARLSDSVSGLVQRRFLVCMDSTQFFVAHRKWFSTRLLSAYSGTSYGSPRGLSWPPWVPMEVMFDFSTDPFGFKRVVQKTSAMLRYDKFNNLRLKYTDGVNTGEGGGGATASDSLDSRMDNLWVEFPQARALCNSSQYYAIYVIVLDLLMYSEPLEKTRNERLEKIMLASDFSDLRGAPEMVIRLQERVRQLEDIKTHFQIYSKSLDERGWEERLLLERDLTACEDELFFIMKAITTSQDRNESSQSTALLKWSISAREIVWHLIRDNNEPLVELQLKEVEYDRTDNADGSHINLVQVGKILGLNLLPDATYPEMIVPYLDERGTQDASTEPMVRVYWYMMEAIAGITVMDHFEMTMFPMKVQLEHEVGKKLFEYIFPGTGDKAGGGAAGGNGNESPTMVRQTAASGDEDTEDDEMAYSLQTDGGERKGSTVSERDGASVNFDTRPGSLELRLQPTLTSNQAQKAVSEKHKAMSVHSGDGHSFRFLRQPTVTGRSLSKKPSHESLQSGGPLRAGPAGPAGPAGRTSTGLSANSENNTINTINKRSRFTLRGASSKNTEDKQNTTQSDDLTKMITRASNYKTFSYIRMPSVVLCLSYKGKGERNIEDVHDFVFRLPTIEYRNKVWSNLDLALALKGRVIKALISHTGAIIGNKLSKHRPNTAQQTKLRELATSSVLLSTPAHEAYNESGDDSSSMFGTSPVDYSRSPPRSVRGVAASMPMAMPRPGSQGSSIASSTHRSYGGADSRSVMLNTTAGTVPKLAHMVPPTPQDYHQSYTSGVPLPPPSRGSNYGDYLRPVSRGSTLSSIGAGGAGGAGGGGGIGGGIGGVVGESGDRKRSAFGGVRNKLSALASRVKDGHNNNNNHGGHGHGNSGGSGGGGSGGGSSGQRAGVHSSGGPLTDSENEAESWPGEELTPVRRQTAFKTQPMASSLDDEEDDDGDDADTDVPKSSVHRSLRTKTT